MAYYSQEAYCLNNENGKIGDGIYADSRVQSPSTEIEGKIIFFFKGQDLTQLNLLKQKNTFQQYPVPEMNVPPLIEKGFYTKFTTNNFEKNDPNGFDVWKNLITTGQEYTSAEDQLIKVFDRFIRNSTYRAYPFHFTGHGEGGVWALLAALSFQKIFSTRRVIVTTFGSPRLGDIKLARYINQKFTVNRVTNSDDVIPSYPNQVSGVRFAHSGTEYWIPESPCDCSKPPEIVWECNVETGDEHPVKNY
ncbi:hypothetical protein G9A89_022381 [Geosiphon pyriformis]|nr:hypothetical protein G9A89_022381 [Geosiphon pyriformis]